LFDIDVDAMQERLTARGSKVIAVAAAPGMATTELQKTTSKAGFALQAALRFVMKHGQSEEDGALCLLQCTAMSDVTPGSLCVPKHKGLVGSILNEGCVGPPIEKVPEAQGTNKRATDMLWQKSEAACGQFWSTTGGSF
jgi:hypothetical protein